MGVLKNGVGRPSNETIKKRNIFKILCLVLFIAVIGLVAYILNDKGIIKTNKKTEKTDKKVVTTIKAEENNEDEINKALDIYNELNKYLNNLDMLVYSNNIQNYSSYFYLNDKISSSELPDEVKFSYSFGKLYNDQLEEMYNTNSTSLYDKFKGSVKDVNEVSKKLFGSNFDIINVLSNKNLASSVYGVQTIINDDEIKVTSAGVGDICETTRYSKIIEKKSSANKVIIKNKVMYVESCGFSDKGTNLIYKTALNKLIERKDNSGNYTSFDNIIKELPDSVNLNDIKIDDYLDKLDTFKWIFTKTSDGNYVFDSVEKVEE